MRRLVVQSEIMRQTQPLATADARKSQTKKISRQATVKDQFSTISCK